MPTDVEETIFLHRAAADIVSAAKLRTVKRKTGEQAVCNQILCIQIRDLCGDECRGTAYGVPMRLCCSPVMILGGAAIALRLFLLSEQPQNPERGVSDAGSN